MKWISAFLFAVLLAVPASRADHCQQLVQSVQTIVSPIATVHVPVVQSVVVPYYTAVYQPPQEKVQTQTTQSDEILLQILAELKAMRSELDALKSAPAPKTTIDDDKLKLVKNSCGACHSSQRSEISGGGFTMFAEDGSILKLEESDKKRIVSRVTRNSMPPPEKKLSAADKQSVLDYFK